MSDKFKFSEENKSDLRLDLETWQSRNFGYDWIVKAIEDNVNNRIESIIQDRGNSIQDGWIDVDRINKYGKHQHTRGVLGDRYISFDYWRDDKKPLPSAPKQPKK